MKKGRRRGLCILLALVMIFSLCTGWSGNVSAADHPEPASIQDSYEIDGVNYFNIGSDAFAVSPEQYMMDMLGTSSKNLRITTENLSTSSLTLAELWLLLTDALLNNLDIRGAFPGDYDSRAGAFVRAVNHRTSYYNDAEAYVDDDPIYYNSLKQAEQGSLYRIYRRGPWYERSQEECNSIQASKGYFKDEGYETPQNVIAIAGTAYNGNDGNTQIGVAAYFSDMKVIPILPEDKDNNYVTTDVSSTQNTGKIIASNVRNLTESVVNASQGVSRTVSASVSSTISGSESYSMSKSLKIGVKKAFSLLEASMEGSISEEEAVSKGWSKGESSSKTDSASASVSVNLEPYTNIMLSQRNTTATQTTYFNCPVAITYTVTFVIYNREGSVLGTYTFDEEAREDLKKRAITNSNLTDKENIDWEYFKDKKPDVYAAIEKIVSNVPMSSTGAYYTETLNTLVSEVHSILPIYPLYKVKIHAPDVPFLSDKGYSYGSYNYLSTDMYVGDYSYTNYMTLDALNKYNISFFSFNKDFGHWVVADKDGNEWTGDDAPVVIEKDPVSKNTMYTAVRPGECYLKYVIDEDVYRTSENPEVYIKNSDLYQTAAVRIRVLEQPFKGSVKVNGSFTGYTDDYPVQLDAEGNLTVDILDESGKEIVKPYVWEQKELESKGIHIDGNKVTFTKTGTFHVRAVSGNVKSDWVEIRVLESNEEHKLQVEADIAKAEADALQQEADRLRMDADVLQSIADDAKATYDAAVNEIGPLKTAYEEAKKREAELEAEWDQLKEEANKAGLIVSQKQNDVDAAQAALDSAATEEEKTAAQMALAAAQTALAEAQAEYTRLNDEIDKIIDAYWDARETYNDLYWELQKYDNTDLDKMLKEYEDAQNLADLAYENVSSVQAKADEAYRIYEEKQSIADDYKESGHSSSSEDWSGMASTTRKAWDTTMTDDTSPGNPQDSAAPSKGKAKLKNTLKVKGKTLKIKAKVLKKNKKAFKVAKLLKISGARGTVTYKLASVKKTKAKKYFKMNSKTGRLTVKKGLKKGKYKLKIKVTASGNATYDKTVRTVLVKVNVR